MFFKKFLKGAVGLASIAIVLAAIVTFLPNGKVASLLPMDKKIEPANSLSGRVGSDGPINT